MFRQNFSNPLSFTAIISPFPDRNFFGPSSVESALQMFSMIAGENPYG
ncbi:MAG: hypothetical protein IKK19_05205 [Bacteroidales bacterium]|nr:hypothetical protein [Bacteroidales bacterium]